MVRYVTWREDRFDGEMLIRIAIHSINLQRILKPKDLPILYILYHNSLIINIFRFLFLFRFAAGASYELWVHFDEIVLVLVVGFEFFVNLRHIRLTQDLPKTFQHIKKPSNMIMMGVCQQDFGNVGHAIELFFKIHKIALQIFNKQAITFWKVASIDHDSFQWIFLAN